MRIEVRDAAIRFGSRVVFSGLSADFHSGLLTAVAGPSGSGKSSLLAAVGASVRLSGGTITFVSEEHLPASTKDLVVWVPQGSNVVGPRSALDNVMLGPLSAGQSLPVARSLAETALEKVGLAHCAGQAAHQLSGGELQRLGLARCLASEKPVILADEPTASLDATNTAKIAGLLRQLTFSAAVIVATHDPLVMAASDEIVRLR